MYGLQRLLRDLVFSQANGVAPKESGRFVLSGYTA
jgi:hypothetical protein